MTSVHLKYLLPKLVTFDIACLLFHIYTVTPSSSSVPMEEMTATALKNLQVKCQAVEVDKISKWGWTGDRRTCTNHNWIWTTCSKWAVLLTASYLLRHCQAAAFSRQRWVVRRCERREGGGFGDFECFSHSLVTVRQKVQKYSSEKHIIVEDENEGRHPNETTREKQALAKL